MGGGRAGKEVQVDGGDGRSRSTGGCCVWDEKTTTLAKDFGIHDGTLTSLGTLAPHGIRLARPSLCVTVGMEDDVAAQRRIKSVSDVTSFVAARLAPFRGPNGIVHSTIDPYLQVGATLEGRDGYNALDEARTSLEDQLAETLRSVDALSLFFAARCISPRLWTSLDNGDAVHGNVRSILELAIQKHGRWHSARRDLSRMPAFLPSQLTVLAKAFVLSEAYANLLPVQRRVAKGQQHRITSTAPLDFEADHGELDRLIARLDRRWMASADPLATYGTISAASDGPTTVPLVIGARHVEPSEVLDAMGDFAIEHLEDGTPIRSADRVTRWGFIADLEEHQTAVAPFDDAMRQAAGCGLIDLHAVQHLVSIAIVESLDAAVPLPMDLLGLAEVPPQAMTLWRDVSGTHPYDRLGPALAPTPESVLTALDRLIVDPVAIDLANPTVRRPLIFVGEVQMIYDLSVASLFTPLDLEGQLTEAERQAFTKSFEARTHQSLADLGIQPWPSGRELKTDGKTLTDVDASVQIGSTLVVADCYSSPWSRGLDLGENRLVRNRADHLVRKIGKWQRLWRNVAAAHCDLLPDGVEAVVPVVATAGPEWVPSEAPNLWFEDDVPTIITVPELRRLMLRHRPDSLPNTIPVR